MNRNPRTTSFRGTLGGLVLSTGLLAAATIVACGSSSDDGSSSSGGASGGASGGTSGASGGFGSGDGGGASSGASGSLTSGCANSSKKANKAPVDMIIGLDTSFSMDFDDKWINVRDALKVFVGDVPPVDLQVGLQFFPIRQQCSVADYAIPAVALAPLSQSGAPISAALDAKGRSGGTPMVPLLQGLTSYLIGAAKPGRKQVIVLTTDGIPDQPADTCAGGPFPNTLDNAVVAAGTAFKGNPSILTFVIGVGGELSALNAVAVAGGTTAATLIDSGGNVQETLINTLDSIRRNAIPCDFDIPSGTIDVNETNVTYTSGGNTSPLTYVGDEASCGKAPNQDGWYFDDANAPKKVVLCNALCQIVKADDQGSVDLVFGCPRNNVK